MNRSSIASAAAALSLLALAGCAQDVVTQMSKSTKVRADVMAAIAADPLYAQDMTQKMVESDSVRMRVVETMLLDPRVAQYVLNRIGRNPDAVDYVLQAALTDSIGRAHLVARMETIRKGLATAR